MQQPKYRVLVIDDNELIRFGLVHVLSSSDLCTSVEAVASFEEAGAVVERQNSQIILAKFDLIRSASVMFRHLRHSYPTVKVLVLLEEDEEFWEALNFECEGYVIRHMPVYQIDVALRAIGEGYAWIGPMLSRYLLMRGGLQRLKAAVDVKPVHSEKLSSLSNREREILYLLSEAFTGDEIAEKLCIAKQTVKLHISNCIRKMGVKDRSQAVAMFLRCKSSYGQAIS